MSDQKHHRTRKSQREVDNKHICRLLREVRMLKKTVSSSFIELAHRLDHLDECVSQKHRLTNPFEGGVSRPNFTEIIDMANSGRLLPKFDSLHNKAQLPRCLESALKQRPNESPVDWAKRFYGLVSRCLPVESRWHEHAFKIGFVLGLREIYRKRIHLAQSDDISDMLALCVGLENGEEQQC